MHTYHMPLDLVRERSWERPVAMVRPHVLAVAANWFQENFDGLTLYAVKANPDPLVVRTLSAFGISAFDVASLPEVELVAGLVPDATIAFMHPIKSREAIARAYFDFGVRTFALDCQEELEKILSVTGHASDLDLIVRLAVQVPGAVHSLYGKFGVPCAEAAPLLLQTRRATQSRMGVSFHVGSQCMNPMAYPVAMAQISTALVRAGVFADIVDVGGGFPSIYPGMTPPPLNHYMAAVHRGFSQMRVSDKAALWCEPGRALVAEASSLMVRVELRKGETLYLNDGAYGCLFDAAHIHMPLAVQKIGRRDCHGTASTRPQTSLKPFRFFGPTCDSIDVMPGPYWLPEDVEEGDYLEIGQMGAYGVAMATRFNGYGCVETVTVANAPMASLYGLAPSRLDAPETEKAANHNVVRMTGFRKSSSKKRRKR